MEQYGVIYRRKDLTILNIKVGYFTARYTTIEGGAKGYVTFANRDDSTPIVLSEISIPNGTIEQVKNTLNLMFDSLTVTKEDIKS